MTLLKDNNYKNINIALLALEADIKKLGTTDTSAIDAQLADINKRINEINANTGGDISAEIDVINNKINDIRLNINNINNDISNVNTEIDTINSDVDSISTEIETLQGQVTSNTEDITNLQTQLNSKAPKTGSSSNFQSNTHYYKSLKPPSDFDYVVVPILDISSSTAANRYSSGKLFTHRNNGLFSDPLVEWKCNKSYNSTASEKYSLTVYKKSDFWKFCTFTYNGVKYLGVVYNYTTASVTEVYFDGYTSSMTSPLFTVIKYNDTQDGVTNTEIYNSLTILETEEYHALSSETEKRRERTWYGAHSSYIKLGSLPVSSGTVSFVNLDIDIRSANGDASFPTGKINANISSGSYSTGFNINGYSTIDISDTSSTLYPRLIVEKTSTDYNVYIYCSYNYLAIKVSDEYNNGWEAASFTESASLSGTTVYDSATSKAIININDLQRKDSAATFEYLNGYNGLGAGGNYTAWLRTPVSGIIPYDARSNATSSKLGTPNWKFAEVNALTVNAETLNAETLNGNATTASSWAKTELDLTSQSNSNFYPVIITTGQYGFADVEIASQGASSSAPYNQNRIKFTLSANGWSDTPRSLFISEYACYDTEEITIGCIGYGTQSFQNGVIWLRGGIKYYCRTMNTSLALKTESYTQGNGTVTIGTNYYGGTNTNITILFTPQTTITNGLYANRPITASSFRGNATSATKLSTARDITVDLDSTSSASFDGTEDITPGVTGTLPVENGGTGKTTLEAAANSLINGLSTGASTPSDNDFFISQYASGGTTTTTYHRRPLYKLWTWIKSKVSSVLGLSEGKLNIRGTTYSTVTATDDNPHIEFAETYGTQPVRLTYTSYDTYQSPASLTLVGGQGGEYFIAPNIKATSKFYGSLSGNATSATKLETARKIRTSLSSIVPASFDGTEDILPGVTGVLPVANGGTGNIVGNCPTATRATQDADGNDIIDTYATKVELQEVDNKVGQKMSTTPIWYGLASSGNINIGIDDIHDYDFYIFEARLYSGTQLTSCIISADDIYYYNDPSRTDCFMLCGSTEGETRRVKWRFPNSASDDYSIINVSRDGNGGLVCVRGVKFE